MPRLLGSQIDLSSCCITLPAIEGLPVIHPSGLSDCGIAIFQKLRYHRPLKHKERDVVSPYCFQHLRFPCCGLALVL